MTLPELRLAGWHAAKDSWVPGPARPSPDLLRAGNPQRGCHA